MEKVWLMNKTSVGTEESAGAVIRRCSVNKGLRKIAQNYEEHTYGGVSF